MKTDILNLSLNSFGNHKYLFCSYCARLSIFFLLIIVALNPTACSFSKDLLSPSGTVIRTACLLNRNTTYNQASAACKSVGMSLLPVDSSSSKSVSRFLSTNNLRNFYISGRTVEGCKRISNVNSKVEIKTDNCYDTLAPLCGFKR